MIIRGEINTKHVNEVLGRAFLFYILSLPALDSCFISLIIRLVEFFFYIASLS